VSTLLNQICPDLFFMSLFCCQDSLSKQNEKGETNRLKPQSNNMLKELSAQDLKNEYMVTLTEIE
jgi:hypothetical protein